MKSLTNMRKTKNKEKSTHKKMKNWNLSFINYEILLLLEILTISRHYSKKPFNFICVKHKLNIKILCQVFNWELSFLCIRIGFRTFSRLFNSRIRLLKRWRLNWINWRKCLSRKRRRMLNWGRKVMFLILKF